MKIIKIRLNIRFETQLNISKHIENTEKHILADVEVVYNAVSNTVNNAVGIPGNALSNAVGMPSVEEFFFASSFSRATLARLEAHV